MTDNSKPDVFYGLEAIGRHVGMTRRQAKHRAETGELPTFKLGRAVCARRLDLDGWLSKLAAAVRKPVESRSL